MRVSKYYCLETLKMYFLFSLCGRNLIDEVVPQFWYYQKLCGFKLWLHKLTLNQF